MWSQWQCSLQNACGNVDQATELSVKQIIVCSFFSFTLRLLHGLHPALSYLQIILDTSPRAKRWRECSTCLLFLEEQQKLLLLLCTSALRWTIATFFLFLPMMSRNCTSSEKVTNWRGKHFLDNLVPCIYHLYFKYSSRRCCILLKQCFSFEW